MKTPRTKKDMIAYLVGHFRYDTMNSWNRTTSYAANVKIYNINFPNKEVQSRAYDLLGTENVMDDVQDIMQQFGEDHDYEWQVGFNGRSGGYIVLYQGGRKKSEHKSVCTKCGQRNFKEASPTANVCGRCHEPARVNREFYEIFTKPGKGTDMGEDFEEWDTYSLKQRVKLVMEFDRMVEQCTKAFVDFCVDNEAVEETVMVPQKHLVARNLENGTRA